MSAHVAEGNIIATPMDIAIWGRRLLRGEAGPDRETVAMMKEGKDMGDGSGTGYGLGLIVNTVDPGVS